LINIITLNHITQFSLHSMHIFLEATHSHLNLDSKYSRRCLAQRDIALVHYKVNYIAELTQRNFNESY